MMQPPGRTRIRDAARPLGVALLTLVVYTVVGLLAVQLAVPPSYSSAVYPGAGIAVAAALVCGRPALLGVALGGFAVNFSLAALRMPATHDPLVVGMTVGLVVGIAAALQAALAAWLVRRFVSQPLTLTEPRDLWRFALLAGPLACLVSATLATVPLLATGVVSPSLAASSWFTWWTGDTLGVLVGAPIALAFIGRPRSEWAPRMRLVALPMVIALVLLGLAAHWVIQGHLERVRTAFERDAWGLAERVDAELRRAQDALLGVHGALDTRPPPRPSEFQRIATPWLTQQPFIVAIGYSEQLTRAEVPAFEARAAAEGPVPDYRVFDRADAPAAGSPHEVVAIRHIEPLASNRSALGVNALSIRAARRAIERAAATGEVAASSGFRLTQSAGDETGIVLYQALYDGTPRDDAARRAALRGVVFVTLRLDALVGKLLRDASPYLYGCLLDADPGAERPRLAGPVGCEQAPSRALAFTRQRAIGPRVLRWRIEAEPTEVAGVGTSGGFAFSAVGLGATGLLGALLLLVSGRQRRIEAAVAERTAELQRTGRALRESEEQLRNIVDHVPIGVLDADADGTLRGINPAMRAMTGLAAGAPLPSLHEMVPAGERRNVDALLARVRGSAAAPASARLALQRPKAAPLPVQLTISALPAADGQAQRLVGVIENVDERERLRAAERARDLAEAASRAKSEFVGRMSHELRTPLNAMLGFAQLLAHDSDRPLAPHQQRWAGQIQDAGWHLLNLINDTLDLSLIESGVLRLQPSELDPVQAVHATLPLVAAAAQRRGVTVRVAPSPPGVPRVLGDNTRLRQILTNLLSNAIKYNRPGGQVEVGIGAGEDGTVEIAIADEGPGLTPSQAERLFQPFERLGREGSGVEGAGIGLALSRRLAEAMGGMLSLSPRPGPGACFVLKLPAVAVAAGAGLGPLAAPEDDGAGYARRLVHYVEDNETNVLLMQGMLAQRPQIELTVSHLGLDALGAVRARRPDLILLDMHLPDVDGLELLRHFKHDDDTAAVPVLVLSADATQERIEHAVAAGAAGYLSKPIDLAALLSAVDEILAKADTRWG